MKFIVDENAGPSVAKWLVANGYEAYSVYDETPGIPDEAILEKAHEENFIVVTSDKDFGELVFKNKLPHRGVILLRLVNELAPNKIRILQSLLEELSDHLPDRFVVVTEGGVRIY
jgi:predicted nuclease of predicted toxin-antitoxin system